MNKTKSIQDQLLTTVGNIQHNGWNNRTAYGYHSYNIEEINIPGQRNPKQRLDHLREHLSFKGKNVVDLGCNVGAMLHHLPEINQGIGFDYDSNCITAAKNISKILDKGNLSFHLHDFDINTYADLKNKIDVVPDIFFVLSLGSWVKSWKELYKICLEYDVPIVLEINNEDEGRPQLEFFKSNNRNLDLIISHSQDDMTGNNLRRTFLVTK